MNSAEPAPIIVTAEFGGTDFAWLDGLRRAHFPPERNQLAAHLTLFHHLPPSVWEELHSRLRRATRGAARPRAAICDAMLLGRGVALRVHSEELMDIRSELLEAFHGLLTPQDQARWRPHITVQNKVEPATAKRLYADLTADPTIARPLVITGIATHYYRGGPWELIGRYSFIGR